MVNVSISLIDHLSLCRYLNLFRMTPISIGIKTYVNYVEFTYVTSLYKLRWTKPIDTTEECSTSLPLSVITKGSREASQLGITDVLFTLKPGVGGSIDYLYDGQTVVSTGVVLSGAVRGYTSPPDDGIVLLNFGEVLTRFKGLFQKTKDTKLSFTGTQVLLDGDGYSVNYLDYPTDNQWSLDHRSWGILIKALGIDPDTKFKVHDSSLEAYTDNMQIEVPLSYYKSDSYMVSPKKPDVVQVLSGAFDIKMFDIALKMSSITDNTVISYDTGYFGFSNTTIFGTKTAILNQAYIAPDVLTAWRSWLHDSTSEIGITVEDFGTRLGILLIDSVSTFNFKVVKL